MPARDSATGWGWVSRALHWGMAALILFQLGFGVWMVRVGDLLQQFRLIQLHKSFGTLVFLLALARILWRLASSGRPGWPAGMPRWQGRTAEVSHALLYLGMLVLPVSGWVMASASKTQDLLQMQNLVFGIWTLPDPWVPGDAVVEAAANTVHVAAAVAMAAVVAVHAGAALWHHFRVRDRVLAAMLRGR